MKHYEVTFIVDPVLSGDEIKAAEKVYEEMLKNEGCTIVHVDEMGLKQLAYSINKRSSGIFYCIEFTSDSGTVISKLELALRRDERIMRFLSIQLDKYGIKFNEDRRAGLIGKVRKKSKGKNQEEGGEAKPESSRQAASQAKEAAPAKETAPAKEAAPAKEVAAAPAPAPAPVPAPAPAPVVADAPVEETIVDAVEETTEE